MQDRPLTPQQQRFVAEYLVDQNGKAAYIRSGYRARGNSAETCAARLLRNVQVRAAVEQAQAERSARLGLTADRVLEELAALAFAKLGDYVTWGPDRFELRASDAIDSRALMTVKQVRKIVGRTGDGDADSEPILSEERSVRMFDKLGPLKLLGQHLGLFAEKIDDLRAEAERIAREHNLPPGTATKIVSLAEHIKRGRTG
jgi:phage terminase small subunit